MSQVAEETKSFGEAVKVARLRNGYSVRKLASLTGISPTHICDIEHNRRFASDKSIESLTVALKYEQGFLWALCGRIPPIVQVFLREYPNQGNNLYKLAKAHMDR